MNTRMHSTLAPLLLTLAIATPTLAGSGVQITPDRQQSLISKDVGSDRWTIVYNYDLGTITGNVFSSAGGEPAFVWCSVEDDDGTDVRLSCSTAARCSGECPADLWSPIGSEISLPRSFFLPPDVGGGPGPGGEPGTCANLSGNWHVTSIGTRTCNDPSLNKSFSASGEVVVSQSGCSVSLRENRVGSATFKGTVATDTVSLDEVEGDPAPGCEFVDRSLLLQGPIHTGASGVTSFELSGRQSSIQSCNFLPSDLSCTLVYSQTYTR